MKTKVANLTFADLPTDYQDMVRMFPLRPIRDEIDLDNATEIADAMAGHALGPDQDDYFAVLTTLMDEYERAHVPQPRRTHDPVGNLMFLMQEHGMNASDLGRLLGQRELGSKLLRKERQLSKAVIVKLADHFHVSPACFL
jgi:antitoxin component HigA of HigAB toxin-antitoxin module